MIITLTKNTTKQEAEKLMEKFSWMGFTANYSSIDGRHRITLLKGVDGDVDLNQFKRFPEVDAIIENKYPYKLAARETQEARTVIDINGVKIGGDELVVMAGPCAIESQAQIEESAAIVSSCGAKVLRGGAFKPRTSPYAFQGLGEEGLKYLKNAADKYNLVTVTEIMDASQIEVAREYTDIFQIGTRNMQNFHLLKEIGKAGKPVFLKRGFSATYVDFLMAAEYILAQGNPDVILCERGIRTHETYSRNTLDLAAVPILKEMSHLPIIVDPSHGVGIRKMVTPMAKAAVAAGCDGLMIEVHPRPDEAVSDKDQTLNPKEFGNLMEDVKRIRSVV